MRLPDSFKKALRKQKNPAFSGAFDTIESCPTEGGIYILLLQLDAPMPITRPRTAMLEPGLYAYIGSAYGPGGLRARLGRHLRPEKKLRWHIDQVSTNARDKFAYGWTDGKECDLRASLDANCPVTYPLAGFGSSDCRICPSHLLQILA